MGGPSTLPLPPTAQVLIALGCRCPALLGSPCAVSLADARAATHLIAVPRAPKKCATSDCEERVRGRRHCPDHTVAWKGSTRGKGPSTAAKSSLRREVLDEEPECRDCGATSTVAGHIIPEAYGGPYTRANLKGQCVKCNNAQIPEDRKRWLAGEFAGGGVGGV